MGEFFGKCNNQLEFLLPQANGHTYVPLGAPIQLTGCFEIYPSTCRVFFFKIWMIGKWFNHMPLDRLKYIYITCLFVSQGFMSIWNIKKFNMINF